MRAIVLRCASTAAAVVALAGCAAIEINVDVYKGPMANDEAIQLRQYAAMAMAAKPVLELLQTGLKAAAERDGDAERFIDGVLSYYDDKLTGPAAQALEAAQRADRNTRFLDEESRDTGAAPAAAVARIDSAEFRDPKALAYLCAWVAMLGGATTNNCNETFERAGFGRHDSRIRPSHQFQQACLEMERRERLTTGVCPASGRATAVFASLADPSKVRQHALLLFGQPKADFEAQSMRVGQSYLDARRAVSDLALALMTLLRQPDVQRGRTQDNAISMLLSRSLDADAIACAATGAPAAEVYVKRVFPNAVPRPREVRLAITQLVPTDPGGLGTALLALDGLARALGTEHSSRCGNSVDNLTMKWFGIAAGPRDNEDLDGVHDLAREVGGAIGPMPFSWDRGRPVKGIETLFEELSAALTRHAANPLHADVQQRAAALTDSLVPFAERLSFVVNNSALFRKGTGSFEAERHVLQTLANTLIVHANDLRRRRVHAENQRRGFDSELLAAQAAAQATPGEVFGILTQALEAPLAGPKAASDVKQAAATQASAEATADKTKLDAAEKALKERGATRRQLRLPPPGALALAALFDSKGNEKLDELGAKAFTKPVLDAMRTALPVPLKIDAAGFDPAKELGLDDARKRIEEQIRRSAAKLAKDKSAAQSALLAAAESLKGLAVAADAPKAKFETQRDTVVALSLADFNTAWKARKDIVAAERQAKVSADAASAAAQKSKAKADKAKEESDKAKAEVAAAERVRDLAVAVFPNALKRAAADHPTAAPESLRQAALEELALAKDAAPPADAKAYSEAMSLLRRPVLPQGLPLQVGHYTRLADSGEPAQRDKPLATRAQVMSDIITLLQNRHVAALARADRANAAALEAAIQTAQLYRNEQMFLRPASEYLRSVYASSVIGQDWRDPERNLLLDYLRQLTPGRTLSSIAPQTALQIREGTAPQASGPSARTVQRELDSLFWQNVNRVSLSGGGNANYAIAKDDVGNWYVKSYSSDPDQVFRSARSMALFNMGQRLDLDLLDRADARAMTLSKDPEVRKRGDERLAATAARSGPTAQFADTAQKRASNRYFAQVQQAREKLEARFAGLIGELKPQWETKAAAAKDEYAKEPQSSEKPKPEVSFKLDDLLKNVQSARELSEKEAFAQLGKLSVESMEKQGSYLAYGRALTDALRVYRALGEKVLRQIEEQNSATLTDALKAELSRILVGTINGHLANLAEERERIVQSYLDALDPLVSAAVGR